MKKILVTAGGTATAWHISQVVKEHFPDDIELHICDTNEPYLVPAIINAKKVHKVPPVVDDEYSDAIAKIVERERIDIIIPLIPQEAFLFAGDGDFVCQHNIKSAAPFLKTTNLLVDKLNMCKMLSSLGISTPKVYKIGEVDENGLYMIKPRLGFGSTGVEVIKGSGIGDASNCIIQEYCHDDNYDEVTVEIYNGNIGPRIFSRRRVATKAGVCVKMEPVDSTWFYDSIMKLLNNVSCPKAFNVQFLWNKGEWKLFDCNLRLGAGTALSTAMGFQLTRALLAEMIEEPVDVNWFKLDKDVKAVLRVYQEIVIK